ncbi:MAG: response regulator [Butyrivibrio sp.]|nr:response regulator [Butyrivibrio sp.]
MEAGKKRVLLIVDDTEINREILTEIFKDEYDILEADNGQKAMKIMKESVSKIAAVLLDIVMPEMDGYEVLENMNKENLLHKLPVIMITADTSVDAERTSYQKGAIDVIHKPFDASIVNHRIRRSIELYDNKNNLEKRVDEQTRLLKKQFLVLKKQEEVLKENNYKIIESICTMVEFRNTESLYHIRRVREFTKILGTTAMENYPDYGLTSHRIDVIADASAVHDIGKISVPDYILLKPGKLSAEEFELMKSHTTRGCEILKMMEGAQDKEYYETGYEICRHHHEKYDGKGYPDGLVGEEISIAAQLVSIADAYDALVSERSYKSAFPPEVAYNMIRSGECGMFSPRLMNCLDLCKGDFETVLQRTRDNDIGGMSKYSKMFS